MHVCTNKPVGNVSIFEVLDTTRVLRRIGLTKVGTVGLIGVVCVYGTARIIV